MDGPPLPLRTANMRRRRARILDAARHLIGHGGFEALSLRALAAAADVTVPTIYNLVGNKESVVVALFSDALAEIEARIATHRGERPLEKAEAVATESTGLFREDEPYYRAAFIAVEYLNQSPRHTGTVSRIYAWGEHIATGGCAACADAGLLHGRVAAEVLGAQIVRGYRTSCREWALGHITIDAFRSTALKDVYLSLAADAVETFHAALMARIAELEGAADAAFRKGVAT